MIHWDNFQPGMAYVALSRCESMEDVKIAGKFDITQIKASPRALEAKQEIDEIDSNRRQAEQLNRENNFIVSYLNVQKGLNVKELDVQHDDILTSSDVFGIGETCLEENDKVHFSGYSGVFENVRNGQGTSAFIKDGLEFDAQTFSSDKISAIYLKSDMVDIIFLYISKNYSWNELKPVLNGWINNKRSVAILGDVNWQFDTSTTDMGTYLLNELKFRQLIEDPTHDSGHIIDHIYINEKLWQENPTITQISVNYSDHDLIQLKIPLL